MDKFLKRVLKFKPKEFQIDNLLLNLEAFAFNVLGIKKTDDVFFLILGATELPGVFFYEPNKKR